MISLVVVFIPVFVFSVTFSRRAVDPASDLISMYLGPWAWSGSMTSAWSLYEPVHKIDSEPPLLMLSDKNHAQKDVSTTTLQGTPSLLQLITTRASNIQQNIMPKQRQNFRTPCLFRLPSRSPRNRHRQSQHHPLFQQLKSCTSSA